MLLRRLVAFPESRRILALHMMAYLCLSVEYGVTGTMVQTLLRKTLKAGDWQELMATSTVSIMSLLAIFWNEVYRRLPVGRYLMALWTVAIVPLGLIVFFSSASTVLICVLICSFGTGGIHSIHGDILRNCYPPAGRGRIFSVLKCTEQLVIMAVAFATGVWLDHNHFAYRIYFPIAVVIIGVGFVLLYRITRQPLFRERPHHPTTQGIARSLRGAYRNMFDVLRRDANFRRYETAFCTYGLGWMMCYSLLAFFVSDHLKLNYKQISLSTQVALQFTTLIMLMPAGLLMDRIGPIRLSAWTFIFLIIYPVSLIFVRGPWSLGATTIIFGIGMAGVNLAWTMGPVTLAQDPSQAPHYLAIHATLVSVRALLGQLPAVLYYHYTRQFRPPFVAAAVLFCIGAFLMFRLARQRPAPARAEAEPPVEVVAAQTE